MKINLKDNYLFLVDNCQKKYFINLVIDILKNNDLNYNEISIYTNNVKLTEDDHEDIFYYGNKLQFITIQEDKHINEVHYLTNFMTKKMDSLAIVFSSPYIIEELKSYHSLIKSGNNKFILVGEHLKDDLKNINPEVFVYTKIIQDRLLNF